MTFIMIFYTVIECILLNFTTTVSQTPPPTNTHCYPFYFHVVFVYGPLNLIRLAFRDLSIITSGHKNWKCPPSTNNYLPPTEPPRGACILVTSRFPCWIRILTPFCLQSIFLPNSQLCTQNPVINPMGYGCLGLNPNFEGILYHRAKWF